MKKLKYGKAAVWFAAAFAFVSLFVFPTGMITKAYAMSISDEEMEEALREEFGDLDELDQISDDEYDMDMEQFADQYLDMLENGEIEIGTFDGEVIKDPPLKMSIIQNGMLRYELPNGEFYETNVPNRMITSSPVKVEPSSEVAAVVTKDGSSSSLFNSWYFSEPGEYQIKMIFYKLASENAEDFSAYEVSHYFTITGKKTNAYDEISAPDGFTIVSAKRDGIAQEIENPESLVLEGDGLFEIRYRDIQTRSFYLSTTFERDTVAPFLTFSCEIEEGPVKGPVEFYKESTGDKVYLFYNGESAEAIDSVLSQPGVYAVTAVDDVGNSRVYSLEIKKKYRIFETKTIILALVFLMGVGAWFQLLRRDTKVI